LLVLGGVAVGGNQALVRARAGEALAIAAGRGRRADVVVVAARAGLGGLAVDLEQARVHGGIVYGRIGGVVEHLARAAD
jgi:hypothetical protein